MIRRTPISTLFPYTPLFRSRTPDAPPPARPLRARQRRPRDGRRVRWRTAGGEPAARRQGADRLVGRATRPRSEEHTSELQSRQYLVCRLLLEKKIYREYKRP